MIALTSEQRLIFAVVALILVVFLIFDWLKNARGEEPLPRATRQLKKELERHPQDFEED